MTNRALSEFLERLRSDPVWRDELRSLVSRQGRDPAEALTDFAAGRGYRFSMQDLGGELSDSALEAVTGGTLSEGDPLAEVLGVVAKKPGKKS